MYIPSKRRRRKNRERGVRQETVSLSSIPVLLPPPPERSEEDRTELSRAASSNQYGRRMGEGRGHPMGEGEPTLSHHFLLSRRKGRHKCRSGREMREEGDGCPLSLVLSPLSLSSSCSSRSWFILILVSVCNALAAPPGHPDLSGDCGPSGLLPVLVCARAVFLRATVRGVPLFYLSSPRCGPLSSETGTCMYLV